MNRKMPYDQVLVLVLLALLGFGLVMSYSASSMISQELYGSPHRLFIRQLIAAGIGLLLLMLTMKVDYHFYEKKAVVWGSVAGSAILLIAALFAPGSNGAHRWINLAFLNFQPSETAKLALILLTAHFVIHQKGKVDLIDKRMAAYLSLVGLLLILVLVEPDFGTMMSMALTVSILLYVAGLRRRYYGIAVLAAVPAFFFLVYNVPYRRSRILAFLDPAADPFGAGYQILQSLMAVGAGGLTGRGLAQGTQKLFFLPEPHNDFIFAVIGEETGFLGCSALICLFGLLLWRGIRISLRSDSLFGTYLGLGIVVMITLQALVNMSVVLSLFPTKGLPLPFISSGGSSLLVMLTAIGILLNISKHSRRGMRVPAGETAPVEP